MNKRPTEKIKLLISAIVSLAMFMEATDTTIINTAIPSMARNLLANPIDLKIALISYLLSLAVFIPISGWMADKYGARNVFTSAVGIFTLSSLLCGYSHNLYELVVARTFQGTGGAMMMPVARLVVVRLFDRSELVMALNRIIMPALIGPALGPVLGGLITHYYSWRWIFFVNIPFGIICMIAAWHLMENTKLSERRPLDVMGFILFGFSLASLTFGLSLISESAVSLSTSLVIIIASVIGLCLYFWHSRNIAYPILNTSLLKLRTFRLSFLGNLFCRIGVGGLAFLVPLLLQVGLGYSAALAGALIFPTAVGALFTKLIVRNLLKRWGFKLLLIVNTVLLGCSLWLFCLVDAKTSYLTILLYNFIYGVLISCQYSGMNPLAYADVPAEQYSFATSMINVVQQISVSFGVATCALLLKWFVGFHQKNPILTVTDFHYTFFAVGIITILSIAIFSFLRSGDGQAVY
jgi:EmrB/QacA subfamily drug resistance transporter